MARLLLTIQHLEEEFANLLDHRHELFYADMVNGALRAAKEHQVEAIICGMAFNESRMFDLLRAAKSDPDLSTTPFICCRMRDCKRLHSVLQSIRLACQGLGGIFVDFYSMKQTGRASEIMDVIDTAIKERRASSPTA